MSERQSRERKQAEAAFAKTQDRSLMSRSDERSMSTAEENTASQKAARLARDASQATAKKR